MATFTVENQWGGDDAPWHPGGTWTLGNRTDQTIINIKASQNSEGQLFGTMQYSGEGPIGFKATNHGDSVYSVENQWGGDDAPWHPAGDWTIGCRPDQAVVGLDIKATEGQYELTGNMTYEGEGPIGFRGDKID